MAEKDIMVRRNKRSGNESGSDPDTVILEEEKITLTNESVKTKVNAIDSSQESDSHKNSLIS